jgi:membrane-bound lytic murein transglycosylase D
MKRSLVLAGVLALTPAAHAQGDAAHPGPQPVAPVAAPDRGPLHQELDERRAVRGCPVGEECGHPVDEMREIDVELFGRGPGGDGDPWIEGGEAQPAVTPPAGARPTDLHPELPWLAQLELPDLPIRWDERLIKYLVFYKEDPRGRAIMRGWLEAQGRYKDMMLGYLRRAHLPEDLVYVAMIESSYDPLDTSYAGASGIWQFMPEGGRIYGLVEDHWIDERNDPVRATQAQMDYFKDLYARFGDWHLALAAFNAGFGAVLKSVARYNTNDFWQLAQYENALPWETTLYVPKALACAIVGHNKKLFGYEDVKPLPPESWDEVQVPTSISLDVIAQAAGAPVAVVKRLNPHLKHGRTPPGTAYVVRVPRGGGERFLARLGELRREWDGYDAYVVAHGERFEDVALEYGISTAKLRALNGLDDEGEVEGGMTLVVPHVSEADRARNLDRALDNLYASGVDSKRGEPLIVAVPDKDADVPGRKRVFYRVVDGDSVRSVAKAFGVTPAELVAWNGVDAGGNLHPRMILQAWVEPEWSAKKAKVRLLDETRIVVVTRGSREHLDLAELRTGRVRLEYSPKKKESFEQIGKKFGLGKRDVARINRMSAETVVEPGQTIIVYQVVECDRSARAQLQCSKAPAKTRGTHAKVEGTRPAEHTANAGDTPGGAKVDAAAAGKDDGAGKDDDDDKSDDKADDKGDDDKADDKPADDKPAADDKKPAAKKAGDDDKKPAAKKAGGDDKPEHGRTSSRDDGPVASPGDLDH